MGRDDTPEDAGGEKTGKRLRRLKGILLETKNNGLLINGHDARSKQTTVQLYGNRCS